MKRAEALRLLQQHAPELRAMGVAHAQLFGSVARDEADDDSDVDVFVTPLDCHFTLFNLVRVKRFLESLFANKVDVFTTTGTARKLDFKARVEPDLIEVF
jgi:uncharacterized protein